MAEAGLNNILVLQSYALATDLFCNIMLRLPSDPQVWLNKFEANQIGLRGLLALGITKETPKRMINNPKQVIVGFIQLGLSFLLVHLLFERFKSSPYLTTTAMMLA